MNLAKDAFIVLFCLASSGGKLDERERTLIVDFLNRQSNALGRINFAPQEAVSVIATLDLAGRNERLSRALENLKMHTGQKIQLAILKSYTNISDEYFKPNISAARSSTPAVPA